MKKPRQILFESIGKIVLAILAAASLFFVVFSWNAATGINLVSDFESGFSVKALYLAMAAAVVFVIVSCIVGYSNSSKGSSKKYVAELVLEYLDDFAGLLGSSGAIACLMFLNARGISYGCWGLGLILTAIAGKFFCAFYLQKLAHCTEQVNSKSQVGGD